MKKSDKNISYFISKILLNFGAYLLIFGLIVQLFFLVIMITKPFDLRILLPSLMVLIGVVLIKLSGLKIKDEKNGLILNLVGLFIS